MTNFFNKISIYLYKSNRQIQLFKAQSINNKQLRMKKYEFILKTYEKNSTLANSKEIEESKNSLTSMKNKNQFYIEIEAQLVNVFMFFTLANKQFMEKTEIKSLFFKLVEQTDHKQIENIYKKYLQFQRDIKNQSLIDRVKIVHDTIKTHFQKLSKCKQFCDDQKVIKELYNLYPNTTFKLKLQKKKKNANSYIKAFQIKETNRVIIAFFQQKPENKLHQESLQSEQSLIISQSSKPQQKVSHIKSKDGQGAESNSSDRKAKNKSNKKDQGKSNQPNQQKQIKIQNPEPNIQNPAASNFNQWMITTIVFLMWIISMACYVNDKHLIQQLHDENFLRFPQIAQIIDYYNITQIFSSYFLMIGEIFRKLAQPILILLF